ncbi:sensor domain-containing diguanylate cyclase [Marinomonas transparens]|uniref:Diguanylate cyclase n=1 Tax=Marinomonas transparens TaxID=2795388 RepID=A0A934N4M9_9GAMM|nr:sensor domain-containing diguanylate cyclase [Marinomonas transparens]MBJ7536171.1 diguanylate cyclase [Marinomonas transparens]
MTKLSLRSVLIFPYVALIICLALAIGLLSYNTGSHAVKTVSDHLLKETVSRLSQAIDRHVVGSVAALETAFPAGIPVSKDIQTDLEQIRTRLWMASSLYLDPNNYVYYGNRAGQAIGLFRKSIDSGELRVKFDPDEHRTFYKVNGIDSEPEFSLIEDKNFDPRVRPWFQAGWNSLNDIWTSVYIDFGTHNLVATRARRIQSENGEFEGVVATDMSLQSLNDFLGNIDISENAISFIIEPNGMLIASSHSPNIITDDNGFNIRVAADDSGNALLSAVYLKIAPLISGGMENLKPESFSFTDEQNRNIHVAYNKFEDKAGLKWINVVAIPSEDFMEGIKKNVYQTVFLGIFATVLVAVIGLMILHWVAKDLNILSYAVNRVASGYLEKPINIQRNDEIGDLAKNFSAMQTRLHTDYLTGLPNRYAFEQRLKATIEKGVLTNRIKPFTVLFFDLNDFKRINDVFGHDVGDQALKEFALRLKNTISSNDLAARFAGDEFVVILNSVQDENALDLTIQKIAETLSEPLELSGSRKFNLGAAIGVAHYPEDGVNVEDLLIVADKKMYTNKADAKNDGARS